MANAKSAPSLDDLAAQLAGKGKAKPSKAKKDRLTLDSGSLPDDVCEIISQYCESKTVFDLIDGPYNSIKKEAKDAVMPVFLDKWFEGQSLPQNPALQINNDKGKADHTCMFTLTEKFYPQIDLDSDDDPATVALETLCDSGMKRENAERFIEAEMDFAPVQGMESFNHLSKGKKRGKEWIEATEAEKAVATKMLKFVLGHEVEPLTEEERELAVFVEPNVAIKGGVFQRLHTYANTKEDLGAMLDLINPVYYLKAAKFGVSDSPQDRNKRLIGVVADMVGLKMG